MIVAAMAGIRVFATGGIGGVHRGAEVTMDLSADLEELARTPVAVVCAGAKSILAVSYTHLDVYKRQNTARVCAARADALRPARGGYLYLSLIHI